MQDDHTDVGWNAGRRIDVRFGVTAEALLALEHNHTLPRILDGDRTKIPEEPPPITHTSRSMVVVLANAVREWTCVAAKPAAE